MTANSKPGSPRWLKVLANIGFVAVVVTAFSLFVTLQDINRQNRTKSAITELCKGMRFEEIQAIMKRNGVSMYPMPECLPSFQDRPFSILDWFDPSVEATGFYVTERHGLWLVKTTNYRFFFDDSKTKEHFLEECEGSPRY